MTFQSIIPQVGSDQLNRFEGDRGDGTRWVTEQHWNDDGTGFSRTSFVDPDGNRRPGPSITVTEPRPTFDADLDQALFGDVPGFVRFTDK